VSWAGRISETQFPGSRHGFWCFAYPKRKTPLVRTFPAAGVVPIQSPTQECCFLSAESENPMAFGGSHSAQPGSAINGSPRGLSSGEGLGLHLLWGWLPRVSSTIFFLAGRQTGQPARPPPRGLPVRSHQRFLFLGPSCGLACQKPRSSPAFGFPQTRRLSGWGSARGPRFRRPCWGAFSALESYWEIVGVRQTEGDFSTGPFQHVILQTWGWIIKDP